MVTSYLDVVLLSSALFPCRFANSLTPIGEVHHPNDGFELGDGPPCTQALHAITAFDDPASGTISVWVNPESLDHASNWAPV